MEKLEAKMEKEKKKKSHLLMKTKAEKKDSETKEVSIRTSATSDDEKKIMALEQEVAVLKAQVASESDDAKPTMANFEHIEDAKEREKSFSDALFNHADMLKNKQTEADESKAKQEEFIANLEKKINAHYERAEKFMEENDISAQDYADADQTFRTALGDGIAEYLIAYTGERGSEAIVYFYGNNPADMAALKECMEVDSSGLIAMQKIGIELGKAEYTSEVPIEKEDAEIESDESAGKSEAGDKENYKQQWLNAKKENDSIKAGKIRKMAEEAGENTNWEYK